MLRTPNGGGACRREKCGRMYELLVLPAGITRFSLRGSRDLAAPVSDGFVHGARRASRDRI